MKQQFSQTRSCKITVVLGPRYLIVGKNKGDPYTLILSGQLVNVICCSGVVIVTTFILKAYGMIHAHLEIYGDEHNVYGTQKLGVLTDLCKTRPISVRILNKTTKQKKTACKIYHLLWHWMEGK